MQNSLTNQSLKSHFCLQESEHQTGETLMRPLKKLIIGMTLTALAAGPALAQPVPGPGPGPGPGPYQPWQRPGPMPPPHHHHWDRPPYGPPHGRWHRGDRFYGPPTIIIRNYGYYNLAPPPAGYYWVQSGEQFLMIAAASGIIASILTAPMH